MRAWYESAFQREYLALYPHRDLAEARADVEALERLISPPKDAPLLDLGCGGGRHLVALWEAGYRSMTGLDLSEELLEVARRALAEVGASGVEVVRADMRRISFVGHFATVLSMFTSFGYFLDDRENEAVIGAVHRALRPGGCLLIDMLNRAATIASLVPEEAVVRNGRCLKIRRSISPDGRRVEKETTVEQGRDGPAVYRESVRMYAAKEMERILVRARFTALEVYGSLTGSAYAPDSPRMVWIARRAP